MPEFVQKYDSDTKKQSLGHVDSELIEDDSVREIDLHPDLRDRLRIVDAALPLVASNSISTTGATTTLSLAGIGQFPGTFLSNGGDWIQPTAGISLNGSGNYSNINFQGANVSVVGNTVSISSTGAGLQGISINGIGQYSNINFSGNIIESGNNIFVKGISVNWLGNYDNISISGTGVSVVGNVVTVNNPGITLQHSGQGLSLVGTPGQATTHAIKGIRNDSFPRLVINDTGSVLAFAVRGLAVNNAGEYDNINFAGDGVSVSGNTVTISTTGTGGTAGVSLNNSSTTYTNINVVGASVSGDTITIPASSIAINGTPGYTGITFSGTGVSVSGNAVTISTTGIALNNTGNYNNVNVQGAGVSVVGNTITVPGLSINGSSGYDSINFAGAGVFVSGNTVTIAGGGSGGTGGIAVNGNGNYSNLNFTGAVSVSGNTISITGGVDLQNAAGSGVAMVVSPGTSSAHSIKRLRGTGSISVSDTGTEAVISITGGTGGVTINGTGPHSSFSTFGLLHGTGAGNSLGVNAVQNLGTGQALYRQQPGNPQQPQMFTLVGGTGILLNTPTFGGEIRIDTNLFSIGTGTPLLWNVVSGPYPSTTQQQQIASLHAGTGIDIQLQADRSVRISNTVTLPPYNNNVNSYLAGNATFQPVPTLPSGTINSTLRHNGTTWESTRQIEIVPGDGVYVWGSSIINPRTRAYFGAAGMYMEHAVNNMNNNSIYGVRVENGEMRVGSLHILHGPSQNCTLRIQDDRMGFFSVNPVSRPSVDPNNPNSIATALRILGLVNF